MTQEMEKITFSYCVGEVEKAGSTEVPARSYYKTDADWRRVALRQVLDAIVALEPKLVLTAPGPLMIGNVKGISTPKIEPIGPLFLSITEFSAAIPNQQDYMLNRRLDDGPRTLS